MAFCSVYELWMFFNPLAAFSRIIVADRTKDASRVTREAPMTAAQIAQKIVANPNGYTEESVIVARAYLALLEPRMSRESSDAMEAAQEGWRNGFRG